jgi:hypothetical protein
VTRGISLRRARFRGADEPSESPIAAVDRAPAHHRGLQPEEEPPTEAARESEPTEQKGRASPTEASSASGRKRERARSEARAPSREARNEPGDDEETRELTDRGRVREDKGLNR